MKLSLAAGTALLASSALAFPSYLDQLPTDQASQAKRALSYDSPYPDSAGLIPIPDAAHPYQDPVVGPPGVGDQRGPCPGLNALANHGYLPRSGIATLSELVSSMNAGFNLGEDLGTVLSAISIALTGNPLTMTVSIGGPDPRVDSAGVAEGQTFKELFGSAAGMNGHNSFETDGSLSRMDYYLNNGDDSSFSAKLYKVMSDIAIANGDDFGLDTTHEAHYRRWLNSKTNNPGWYNMPPSAILTTGAASFVGRCYANGTYGAGGVANAANVDPFFGAVATEEARSDFTFVPERFAPKWFRSVVSYDTKEVLQDILATYQRHPEMLEFGGNAGSTSNFVPLGLSAPTDVNGLACFLYNAQMALLPSQLSHATAAGVSLATATLDSLLSPIFTASFDCGHYSEQGPEFADAFANFTRAMDAGLSEHGLKAPAPRKRQEDVVVRAAEAQKMIRALKVEFE